MKHNGSDENSDNREREEWIKPRMQIQKDLVTEWKSEKKRSLQIRSFVEMGKASVAYVELLLFR